MPEIVQEQMDYREKVAKAFADAKPENGIWLLSELMAVKAPEPKTGDRWGDWTFNRNLTLTYKSPGSEWFEYEIDLEKPTTAWDWIRQFAGKRFEIRGGDAKAVGDLAEAFIDLRKVKGVRVKC